MKSQAIALVPEKMLTHTEYALRLSHEFYC
jgi:hypothetical protein